MSKTIIDDLKEILDVEDILIGDRLHDRYHHIWKMNDGLDVIALVMPRSTEQVSKVLAACTQHKQKVSIHGGLTNLVGGTETDKNELVISTEKLNTIYELDPKSRTVTVGSGVILEEVQKKAFENDLLFPLNFGAKGSAQIGGIVSSNAGGLRVFRFGMTRQLVLGLEAVLADGTIISSLKKIIKDNSGYDLKQLFIGSEGTLGVVTKAVLKLVELPKSRCSAFIGFNDFEKIVSFLKFIDGKAAGTLSGFELMWNNTFKACTTTPAKVSNPLPFAYNYYVLIETLGSNQESDSIKLAEILEQAINEEMILDAVIADSDSDLEWFWTIREDVHAFVSRCTYDQHFDISMPIPEIGSTIQEIHNKLHKLTGVNEIYTFGHVADGNIHLVIDKANESDELREQINKIVYGPLKALGGSVSAEHGIGLHKKKYLSLCRTDEEIGLMKVLKKSLDPHNILNPGRLIDLD